MAIGNGADRPRKLSLNTVAAWGMISIGLLLLVAVGLYYAYGVYARSQLDDLNFTASTSVDTPLLPLSTVSEPEPAPATRPAKMTLPSTSPSAPFRELPASPARVSEVASPSTDSQSGTASNTEPAKPIAEEPELVAFPASSYASMYPGSQIHPKYWGQPIWAGADEFSYSVNSDGPTLPDGFTAVSADSTTSSVSIGETTRIIIPAIGVDSGVYELQIETLGDSRAYETPKNIVGHIPQTVNPGEFGNAWYFGHLESPIRGEGNVFQKLPQIPELLRDGEDVYVEMENEFGHVFLYKVSQTNVVHQDDMHLYGSNSATLTLVACVPRLIYDHRILVTADLVGVKDG